MSKPSDAAATLLLRLNEMQADRNRAAHDRDHAVGERDKMAKMHADAEIRANATDDALKYVYDEMPPGRRPHMLRSLREKLGPDAADAILGLDPPASGP